MKTLVASIKFVILGMVLIAACSDDEASNQSTSPSTGGGEGEVQFGDLGGSGGSSSGSSNGSTNGGTSNTPSAGAGTTDPSTTDPGTTDPDASTDDTNTDPNNDAGNDGPAAGGASGGPSGTQQLGGLCTLDQHCSQAQGSAVCCVAEGCTSPCECALESDCANGAFYLACSNAQDCSQYGGGKVCCEAGSGANAMRYCTKQSACAGTVLP